MEQRLLWRQIIFSNILAAFDIVFKARRAWGVDYESEKSSVSIDFLICCYLNFDLLAALRADHSSTLLL